jgi:hypothetical protein
MEEVVVMRYAVVIEKADGNYSAYVPDLPAALLPVKRLRRSKAKFATRSTSISRVFKPMASPSRRRPASRNMSKREGDGPDNKVCLNFSRKI